MPSNNTLLLEPSDEYVPRHRGPAPWLDGFAPQPGDLPRIRSYNDLGPDRANAQEQQPPSHFETVFYAAADGPAMEPLLGRRARQWRPGPRFTSAVAALVGGGLAVAVVCSPITATAFEIGAGGTEQAWTAHFTGADGLAVPVSEVTCDHLFSEVVKGSVVATGAPASYAPMQVVDPVVLGEQLDEIAALTRGDIRREAIACEGRAHWPGVAPRRIVATLSVDGGEAGSSTMSSKVLPKTKKKPARAGKKAQKKM